MTESLFDPVVFRRELDTLLRRNPDPALHDAVWSYIEGSISRAELRDRSSYTRALTELYRDGFATMTAAGVDFARIQELVRLELEADGDADHDSTAR